MVRPSLCTIKSQSLASTKWIGKTQNRGFHLLSSLSFLTTFKEQSSRIFMKESSYTTWPKSTLVSL